MNHQNQNQNDRQGGEMIDKLVGIRRVAKTVKGGRRMSFSAIVVVGDEAGRVGWANGKAREVPDAVKKATDTAKRGMIRVPLRHGRTIHHAIEGSFGAARVILKPAAPGTGIIAGGPMRAVFEAMGMKDIVAKSLGSSNPFNMIQATFEAFKLLETPRSIAAKRGIKTSDLSLHRDLVAKDDFDAKADAQKAATDAKDAKAAKAEEKKSASKKAAPKKAAPKKAALKKEAPKVEAKPEKKEAK